MAISEALHKRRSIYQLGKNLPLSAEEVKILIEEITALIPDAFNMKSARIIVATEENQNILWDRINDVFEGKISREKIDGFKAAAGTILYFYDESVIKGLQDRFPMYAPNFPVWANQANGMLQINIWTALREAGIGANLQHYNPVIDNVVKEMFDVPDDWKLIAQMPFGEILSEPESKETEDISARVRFF